MNRVAITGVGILSSLGTSYGQVTESLRGGVSGIRRFAGAEQLGLPTSIAGMVDDLDGLVKHAALKKKQVACMSRAALFGVLAAKQAIEAARLGPELLASARTACFVGSGGISGPAVYENAKTLYNGRPTRMAPYAILHTMASATTANIATVFGIGGRSYSVTSACATSAHNVGHAFDTIAEGSADIALAGGAEEIDELTLAFFCAMRIAVTARWNHAPERASRPCDKNRSGFVLSEGAGVLVLENWEVAQARGAPILAELVGFAANTDRTDVVHPDPNGVQAASCMQAALERAELRPASVDYLNAHASSTTLGDEMEMQAIRSAFGTTLPFISSTKSMGGHALGAAGVHEAIHCISMLQHGYLAPSINIDELDPKFEGLPIVRQTREHPVRVAVSNSFAFGGANASLVFKAA
jgi:3-oxoacyl-[acyl-carrier-protein] synthase-1